MKNLKKYLLAAKKGWTTPNLPENIIRLQLHPVIRIFRVIGGVSTLLLITNRVQQYSLPLIVYIGAIFIAVLFLIYNIYVSYYRFKHMIKILKSDQLDIRNSPLHRIATICARMIYCAKGFCDSATPVGTALGVMGGIDGIRQSKGLDPIFYPFIADIFIKDTPEQQISKERSQNLSDLYKLAEKQKNLEEFKKNITEFSQQNESILSTEDKEIIMNDIVKEESEMLTNKNELFKKIKDSFDKNKK